MTPIGIISQIVKTTSTDTKDIPVRPVHLVAVSASTTTTNDPPILVISADSDATPIIDNTDKNDLASRLADVSDPYTERMPSYMLPHPFAINPHYDIPIIPSALDAAPPVRGDTFQQDSTEVDIHVLASLVTLDALTIAVALNDELFHTTKLQHTRREVQEWWMEQQLPRTTIYRIVLPSKPSIHFTREAQIFPIVGAFERMQNTIQMIHTPNGSKTGVHLCCPLLDSLEHCWGAYNWIAQTDYRRNDLVDRIAYYTNIPRGATLLSEMILSVLPLTSYPLADYITVSTNRELHSLHKSVLALEVLEHLPEETVAQRMKRIVTNRLAFVTRATNRLNTIMIADTKPMRTVLTSPSYLNLLSPLYSSVHDIPIQFVELLIYLALS